MAWMCRSALSEWSFLAALWPGSIGRYSLRCSQGGRRRGRLPSSLLNTESCVHLWRCIWFDPIVDDLWCLCQQNGAGEVAAAKPATAAKSSKTKAALSSQVNSLSCHLSGDVHVVSNRVVFCSDVVLETRPRGAARPNFCVLRLGKGTYGFGCKIESCMGMGTAVNLQ